MTASTWALEVLGHHTNPHPYPLLAFSSLVPVAGQGQHLRLRIFLAPQRDSRPRGAGHGNTRAGGSLGRFKPYPGTLHLTEDRREQEG